MGIRLTFMQLWDMPDWQREEKRWERMRRKNCKRRKIPLGNTAAALGRRKRIMQHTVRDTIRRAKRDAGALAYFRVLLLEPMVGLEPTTCCLRNSVYHWTHMDSRRHDRIPMPNCPF